MSFQDRYAELLARLEYRFVDENLLQTALTHTSYAHERGEVSYERLEFLGDAVLDLVVAERLYEEDDAAEGTLTQRRAQYVSENALFASAETLLTPMIRLGPALIKGQNKAAHKSIVADAVEAVLGAVFIDGGWEAAKKSAFGLLGDIPAHIADPVHDKTALQERLQAAVGKLPTYRTDRLGGPDHAPLFLATVSVGDAVLASAEGPSQKQATKNAAEKARAELAVLSDEEVRARLLP